VSLTAPMIARSRRTWFFAAGADKADALAHVFAQANNPQYPSSFANGTDEFTWFSTPETIVGLR
jgi:6-phosphogluconolactonase